MSTKFSRPLAPDAQNRLRERIAADGVEATAKALGLSDYLITRGASGGNVANAAAVAIEAQVPGGKAA
jgi:hypothetical protein